eukprot:13539239-Alexandrium_andersonii.AAC.1
MSRFSTGLADPCSSSDSGRSPRTAAMAEAPGSGRAWLEAHSNQRLLAEAAAAAGGRPPSALRGSAPPPPMALAGQLPPPPPEDAGAV